MKLGRKALSIVAVVAFITDFLYIVVLNAVASADRIGNDFFHNLFMLIGFGAFTVAIGRKYPDEEKNPVQLIGKIVIVAAVLLLLIGFFHAASLSRFEIVNGEAFPRNVSTIITSSFLAVFAGATSIYIFVSLAELIFIKRRRNTKRNFLLMIGGVAAYAVSRFLVDSDNSLNAAFGWLPGVLLAVIIILMTVNSFRFSWILLLTRREKLANLALAVFGFIFFVILATDTAVFATTPSEGDLLNLSLLFYHPLIHIIVSAVILFGSIYMGIGFTSTLLHLPTAKEFDRKKTEISSLQNMSRLITQVFDFDELIATSTHLALTVCEGDAAWFELLSSQGANNLSIPGKLEEKESVSTIIASSLLNITVEQIESIRLTNGEPVQNLVVESGKPIIIQDAIHDRRISSLREHNVYFESFIFVPLKSHDKLVGLLCVAKKKPYEFDKDVLNAVYAFSDMVAIALENSRLIAKSIRKERLEQEILVAQEMQRSLLPRLLPLSETYEIAAISIPANEVGGDYYDVLKIDNEHLGLVIGDVSGKGVSAALYMAQLKGIFQSLAANAFSTRETLTQMNATLWRNMERKSFVSLLFAVLDITTGKLVYSRAGHCPLLYISDGISRFLRPDGMGLGLDNTGRFISSLEEEQLQLREDDVILLFTDGITEAKDTHGEEFGYRRLAEVVEKSCNQNAENIMDTIIIAVKEHVTSTEVEDDMTVLALRWKGKSTSTIQRSSFATYEGSRSGGADT